MNFFQRLMIAFGAVLATFAGFAALFSNDEVRKRVKAHYHDSLDAARDAAAAKEKALLDDLAAMGVEEAKEEKSNAEA